MGGNFKFQVQDSLLEYFFFEIWRSKKRISLSGKKPPLEIQNHNNLFRSITMVNHFKDHCLSLVLDHLHTMYFRVTSLEQLTLVVNKLKGYENSHKNILGIWCDLVWKVKLGHIFRKKSTSKTNVIKTCQ